jgi:hypothetical protein
VGGIQSQRGTAYQAGLGQIAARKTLCCFVNAGTVNFPASENTNG